MPQKYTEARKEGNRKWDAANLDRLSIALPKGRREAIKARADVHGESVNSFIGRAISEALEREGVDLQEEIKKNPDETIPPKVMEKTYSEFCKEDINKYIQSLNAEGQQKAEKAVERIVAKSGNKENKFVFLGKTMLTFFKKLNLAGRMKMLERAIELSELKRYCLTEDSPSARILAMLELLKIDSQGKAREEIFKLTREDKYRVSSTEQKNEAEKAPESEPLHDDHVEE